MKVTNVQGDVILKKLNADEIPEGETKDITTELKQGILAYGSVKGKRHQIDDMSAVEIKIVDDRVYLIASKDVQLVHGGDGDRDHASQTVIAGTYLVDGALETNRFKNVIQRVAD